MRTLHEIMINEMNIAHPMLLEPEFDEIELLELSPIERTSDEEVFA